MKKAILLFLFCTVAILSFGQQVQSSDEVFYYEVKGLIYVSEYDINTQTQTTVQKIPKAPLKFKVVSIEKNTSPSYTYYIIKFLPITSDVIKVNGQATDLKGNATFVNADDNDKYFWIKESYLTDKLNQGFIVKSYATPNTQLSYGANVSLPFKLRPSTNGQNIKITPDITLGGYVGAKWRINHFKPHYITFPVVTVGLATLSINENTTNASPSVGDGLVLGLTGSTGLVGQFDDFQFGLMLGWDRAAGELGKDWIYNNKPWYSLSIGYTFLANKKKEDQPVKSEPK